MLYPNARHSARSGSPALDSVSSHDPQPSFSPSNRLVLVSQGGGTHTNKAARTTLFELAAIGSSRCSAFFAEAAVLVLVLGLLDRLMVKGHVEVRWAACAVGLSVALLAASIATDFGVKRWLRAR